MFVGTWVGRYAASRAYTHEHIGAVGYMGQGYIITPKRENSLVLAVSVRSHSGLIMLTCVLVYTYRMQSCVSCLYHYVPAIEYPCLDPKFKLECLYSIHGSHI